MTERILTQEELKSQLHYDTNTGIFTRLKKVANVKIGDIAGGIQITGYINISVNNKPYSAHRLAWLYIYGEFPSNSIDHINGIKQTIGYATSAKQQKHKILKTLGCANLTKADIEVFTGLNQEIDG